MLVTFSCPVYADITMFGDVAVDDDHIGLRITRHHSQQHTLADATAGKQPHALAAADGQLAWIIENGSPGTAMPPARRVP